jgi:hypothetical protein
MAVAIASCLAAFTANAKKMSSPIQISPAVPGDIPGGASSATLTQASRFAWEEFIALNWPATKQTGKADTRDMPNTKEMFGDPSYTGPLVWHTFRSKVEIFPGVGLPPGATANTPGQSPLYSCDYDVLPQYNYANGPASGSKPPWINLDENSQIGLDHIFAGVAAGSALPLNDQILFMAKANRVEFNYICPKGWWSAATVKPFLQATSSYIQKNSADPTPGSGKLVSFPSGTIEVKAAWRRLGKNEDPSRFYTTTARYYVKDAAGGQIYSIDETLALVGLHIIQKTPSAPYFVFATFEQADNILDSAGKPVEDVNGNYLGSATRPLTPGVNSINAAMNAPQSFTFTEGGFGDAGKQLNYSNVPNTGLVTGAIKVERREHSIAKDVIAVNKEAHAAIAAYVKKHFPKGSKTPWAYYKLVSVQSQPINKPKPGKTYDRPDASTYYQANSTIETDYNLQVFSGQFYSYEPELPNNEGGTLSNTITDFTADGKSFKNVAYSGTGYNMGGCMGCHGNAQHGGADFSFILAGGRDLQPDTAGSFEPIILNKVTKYLQKTK